MTAQILVVDDEPDLEALVLQKFRHQIRDGAVSFLFARDGVEALAALKANGGIDLVVTDINMPRMDGLSLLQRLQEGEEKVSTIIVSAYGDMINIRTAMNRGAFDFVTKPIDFADLETTIAKTLRHIEILRQARQRQATAERAYASLSRYFSPNLAQRLASDTDSIDLGGQRREIATLFTDIESFTALVETLEPSVLGPLLNEYLTGMTDIVFAHDGTVAKIVGDALHVLFGAPGEQPDHAARAIACALALDEYAQSIPRPMPQEGYRARGHPHRRARRTGNCRQFWRRPLLRLHRLRRHHQRCGDGWRPPTSNSEPEFASARRWRARSSTFKAGRSVTSFCGVSLMHCVPSSQFGLNDSKTLQQRVTWMRLVSLKRRSWCNCGFRSARWQAFRRSTRKLPSQAAAQWGNRDADRDGLGPVRRQVAMSLNGTELDFGTSAPWSLLGAKRTCQWQANVANDPTRTSACSHVAVAKPFSALQRAPLSRYDAVS